MITIRALVQFSLRVEAKVEKSIARGNHWKGRPRQCCHKERCTQMLGRRPTRLSSILPLAERLKRGEVSPALRAESVLVVHSWTYLRFPVLKWREG